MEYVLILFGIIPTAAVILWCLVWVARFAQNWFALLIFNVLERGPLKAFIWIFIDSVPEVLSGMVLRFQSGDDVKTTGENWVFEYPFTFKKRNNDNEKM